MGRARILHVALKEIGATRLRALSVIAALFVAACSGGTATPSTTPTLFYLGFAASTVNAVDEDGSNPRVLVTAAGMKPEGIAVDVPGGHIYWTSMGVPSVNDGTVLRANLDGTHVQTIVPTGSTYTPKRIAVDHAHQKIYWADREGMRVMRANLDGSNIETLVTTGTTAADRQDQTRFCVGIALDVARGQMYWTQRGPYTSPGGAIYRAGLEIPAGETSSNRTDIEQLFSGLLSPIQLGLDLETRTMYWTSNVGDKTLSRAPMDPPSGYDPAARTDRQVIVQTPDEGSGVTLDLSRGLLFFTSNTVGSPTSDGIFSAALDGTGAHLIAPSPSGWVTGIDLVELP